MERNGDMCRISVVVPCFNVEKYVGELIESLINQSFRDIEVILIDDGSPDNTGHICDVFAERDARLHVIHKPNGGVSAARNDGLKIARGDYVIFVDSDDYLPLDALEALYSKATETDSDIVIGDIVQVFPDQEKQARFYAQEFTVEDEESIQELIKTVFYRTYCPWPNNGQVGFGYGGPCNKLVRRQMLIDHDIHFDLRVKGIYDDIIYSAYILAIAGKVSYIHHNVYNYRILETSITSTYKKNTLEINDAIFHAWEDFLEKYNKEGIYTSAYYANVLRRFDESLAKYFFCDSNPNSLSQRIAELKKIMHKEPYNSIPRYVEEEKLEKRHRKECKLLKVGSAYLVCLFINALSLYRKLRE